MSENTSAHDEISQNNLPESLLDTAEDPFENENYQKLYINITKSDNDCSSSTSSTLAFDPFSFEEPDDNNEEAFNYGTDSNEVVKDTTFSSHSLEKGKTSASSIFSNDIVNEIVNGKALKSSPIRPLNLFTCMDRQFDRIHGEDNSSSQKQKTKNLSPIDTFFVFEDLSNQPSKLKTYKSKVDKSPFSAFEDKTNVQNKHPLSPKLSMESDSHNEKTKVIDKSSYPGHSPSPFQRHTFNFVSPEATKNDENKENQLESSNVLTSNNEDRKKSSVYSSTDLIGEQSMKYDETPLPNTCEQQQENNNNGSSEYYSSFDSNDDKTHEISEECFFIPNSYEQFQTLEAIPESEEENVIDVSVDTSVDQKCDESEDSLMITFDMNTTFDSITINSSESESITIGMEELRIIMDGNKAYELNVSDDSIDKNTIQRHDGNTAESKLFNDDHLQPTSLVSLFEEIAASSGNPNERSTKAQSNVRPSIIFNIEDLMEWRHGIYLSIGSTNFDDTRPVRFRSALQRRRMVQNKRCMNKTETCSNIVWDNDKGSTTRHKNLIQIEAWIKKLQDDAIDHFKNQQYEDALILFKRILIIFQEYPNHAVTGTILHNIGIICLYMDDFETGRRHLNTVYKIRKAANGVNTDDLLNSMHIIAVMEYLFGNIHKARSILDNAIKLLLPLLATKQSMLAEFFNSLACIYVDQKGFTAAADLLLESYELQMHSMRKMSYKFDDQKKRTRENRKLQLINISTTVANIGVIKLHTSDYNNAIIAFEDTILTQSLVLHPYDSLILATMDNLAKANAQSDETTNALLIYSNILQILHSKYGPYHIKCAQIWKTVGALHQHNGYLKGAIDSAHELIKCFSLCQCRSNTADYKKFKKMVTEEKKVLRKLEHAQDHFELSPCTSASF